MRAPAFFGDPRHFNDEGSARNNSFETVPHGVYVSEVKGKTSREDSTQCPSRNKRNEVRRPGRIATRQPIAPQMERKKIRLSMAPQETHASSTGFQHSFAPAALRSARIAKLDSLGTANYSEGLHAQTNVPVGRRNMAVLCGTGFRGNGYALSRIPQ